MVPVYKAEGDELLVCGTSADCARYFGCSINSFHCMVHNVKTGRTKSFCIVVEDLGLGIYTVWGEGNTGAPSRPDQIVRDDDEDALEMWKQGLNDRQISERLGVNISSVFTWRRRMGLGKNTNTGRPQGRKKR